MNRPRSSAPPAGESSSWHEIDALFAEAVDLSRRDRADFLDRSCAGNPALRRGVEALLRAHGEAASFLERPAEEVCHPPWAELFDGFGSGVARGYEPIGDRTGQKIGPYLLTRRIGRGGMATVYLAERADGLWKQRVAIKVVRRGFESEDVVRRFVAERQILSSLDHPNIARLLDGGTTDDGLPYLVMEHVEGTLITHWLDYRRASIDVRLKLFLDVSGAVQFAHRSLVVHRDLKPANILVTDEGRVKLLDFGIAKVLDPTADGLATRTGFQPLTPEYASPEQVRGEQITTASDVYQLGLLLCELVSGSRPYEIRALSPARLEETIATARPSRPSALVTGESARLRATRPERLARILRGDLDLIALTALRKEPDRRYATVQALAADVERFRAGLPIAARPDTLGYRARKLVRRRPWLAPSVGVLFLAAGGYLFTLERHAAELEHERNLARAEAATSREMADFLADVFLEVNPLEGDVQSAAALVDFAVARADSVLAGKPNIHFEVLTVLGRSAYWLGRLDTAEEALERAVRQEAESSVGLDPTTGWWANQYLGAIRYARGDYEAAEAAYRRTLDVYRPILGNRSEPIGRTLNVLGWLYHETGRLDEAERSYREALEIHREASGPTSTEYATSLDNLGLLLADLGRSEEGEALVREAISLRRETLGPGNPNTAFAIRSLGRILYRRGEHQAAEALLREALSIRRSALGPTHHKYAEDVAHLGGLLASRGSLTESRELLEQALAIRRESLGDDHPVTAVTKHQLATVLHRLDERVRARELYGNAVTTLSRRVGAKHGWTIAASEDLQLLLDGRRPADRDWLSGTRLPLPAAPRGDPSVVPGRS